MPPDWLLQFPLLAALDQTSLGLLVDSSRLITVPAGRVVFEDSSPPTHYTLVIDGVLRVQKMAESGREIVLYRVEAGQSCVLNTSGLMTGGSYGAEAIAETEVLAVQVAASVFQRLLAESAVFRQFVFTAYSARLTDLLCLIEEVAFGRIDMRLAQCLLDHATAENSVLATHQELAVELGTAREVVSRQLKEFERRGWLGLFRGRVELIHSAALRSLAGKL